MKNLLSESQYINRILSPEEISFLLHSENVRSCEKKASFFQKSLNRFLKERLQPLFSQTLQIKTQETQSYPIRNCINIFSRRFHRHTVTALITSNTIENILNLCFGSYLPYLRKNVIQTDLEKHLINRFFDKFQSGIDRVFNKISKQEIENLSVNSSILLQIGNVEIKIYLHIEKADSSMQLPSTNTFAKIQLPHQKIKLQDILTWQTGSYIPISDKNIFTVEIISDKKTPVQSTMKIKNSEMVLNFIKKVD